MDGRTQENIEYSMIFDSFQYATDYVSAKKGTTLQKIVDDLKGTGFDPAKIKQLQEMLDANPELKKVTVLSNSHIDGKGAIHSAGKKATDDYIQACAYKFPGKDGDVYVAYRGTGDGRWGDNAEGFTEQSTDMQRDAQKYFDYVVEQNSLDKSKGKLYVTGHSKGGNEAQYVMMTSKYNDKIDGCYSIDGQGFSKSAIKYFKSINKDGKYDELLNKMYSINGENDYVHFLINLIAPNKNTYYIDQKGKSAHDIFSLYENGKIGWRTDENGNVINSEPGYLGRMARELMDDLRKLPEDQQGNCAMALMTILEKIMSNRDVGMDGAKAGIEDYFIFAAAGIPTILLTLGEDSIKELVNAAGQVVSLVFSGVVAGVIINLIENITKQVVDIVYDTQIFILGQLTAIIKKVGEILVGAEEWIVNSYKKIVAFVNKAKEWLYKHSAGYKYATANPCLSINTTTMKNYASQIRTLSSRSKNLDRKMNDMYWHLGIEWDTIINLGRLFKSGIILDFAGRLDKCANYLEQTAEDFNRVERELSNI